MSFLLAIKKWLLLAPEDHLWVLLSNLPHSLATCFFKAIKKILLY